MIAMMAMISMMAMITGQSEMVQRGRAMLVEMAAEGQSYPCLLSYTAATSAIQLHLLYSYICYTAASAIQLHLLYSCYIYPWSELL